MVEWTGLYPDHTKLLGNVKDFLIYPQKAKKKKKKPPEDFKQGSRKFFERLFWTDSGQEYMQGGNWETLTIVQEKLPSGLD